MASTVSIRILPTLVALFIPALVSCVPATVGPAQPPPRAEYVLYEWYDDRGPGEVTVNINLREQRARYFRGGREIGWSYVATGKEGHGTPAGKYKITEKIVDKYSNRYGWFEDEFGNVTDNDAKSTDPVPPGERYVPAPMPYWMRLTNYGIGMHAGIIPQPGEPASHGCIRLPKEFAPILFDAVKVGTPVTIQYEDVVAICGACVPVASGDGGSVFFPISDDDRYLMRPAWVTITLLLANIAVFLWQLADPAFTYAWSVIPAEITSGVDLVGESRVLSHGQILVIPQEPGPNPIQLTILSAMFMHGGWLHLGGNMLYLWIFGDNVEHRFGAWKFLAFYLVSGIVATFAQIAVHPEAVIPNLGASGAISGVLGAYLVLFPRNRVNAVFFFRIVSLPAVVVIGFWALLQVIDGADTFAATAESGGVAYAAHIGGFIAGVVMGSIARSKMKREPDTVFRRHYERDRSIRRYW